MKCQNKIWFFVINEAKFSWPYATKKPEFVIIMILGPFSVVNDQPLLFQNGIKNIPFFPFRFNNNLSNWVRPPSDSQIYSVAAIMEQIHLHKLSKSFGVFWLNGNNVLGANKYFCKSFFSFKPKLIFLTSLSIGF